MKAAVMHAYGGPGVLKYEDLPDPVPGPGEVLIKVAASSVNPFDLKIRSGAMKEVFPLTFPAILGLDVSGTVAEVGAGITNFAHGDKVFANAMQTYASHCVVKANALARIPEGMDLIEAAALPTVTTTGAQLAAFAMKKGAGETVLVTGAVGNVGRSAVWTAKDRGATVIAGVLQRQFAEAKTTGADSVVALDNEESLSALKFIDAVADTIDGAVGETLIGKVKDGGIFASVLSAPAAAAIYPKVEVKTVTVTSDPATLVRMAHAVKEGKLTIPLGQRFALKDAAKAHEAAENRMPGKLLLVP